MVNGPPHMNLKISKMFWVIVKRYEIEIQMMSLINKLNDKIVDLEWVYWVHYWRVILREREDREGAYTKSVLNPWDSWMNNLIVPLLYALLWL